ncbi:MAG: glycoside hydrolase family 9 protein [Verrucomicrobiota bacterium]
MKYQLILAGLLCGFLSANAQDVSFKEIRTASDTELVALFKDAHWSGPVYEMVFDTNQVKTDDISRWKLNGQPVTAINKFVTEADAVDYHIYLQVPKLTNGMAYTLETPYGNTNFVFDDKQIFCESIKVNQNGYSALSHTRYANFAIWLGTAGDQQISGALPAYTVFKEFTGELVAQGTLRPFGEGKDESSGDYAYRIDLSGVPEGGPYKIAVNGYGCSYPFGVGGDFSRRLGYVAFRALYYQRCGCPIVKPYAWADIRTNPCHTVVYDRNQSPPSQDNVRVSGTEPKFTHYGGYHDAADEDRLAYHMMVPIVLLSTYEAFPEVFTDDQFNIPDKFDADYHIVGKGNGIPDILDEAAWGVKYWEYMQNTSTNPPGAVHWGDSTMGYPPWGTPADQDPKLYGTLVHVPQSDGFGAAMFMYMARLIKPYDAQKSADLESRADAAYNAAGDRIPITAKLCYSIQKYLLTGDTTASNNINALAASTSALKDTYNRQGGGFIMDNRTWLASYFMSYLFATNRPTNPEVVQQFRTAIKEAADREIEYLNGTAYPVGWPASINPQARQGGYGYGQGGFTCQGQFAYPCLIQWKLTKEQKYIDAVSQLMDYNMGLNPIGKCYMSGIGFEQIHHPEKIESAYAEYTMGWGGPQPGITVYGPVMSGRVVTGGKTIPALGGLARERRYVDHMGYYEVNEFTVEETEVFPAAIYPVLARGGKWDTTKEPFLNPAPSSNSRSQGPTPIY